MLSSLVDELISEKRMQFQSRMEVSIEAKLSPKSYGIFATIQPIELRRVLSNLVNNAVEAIENSGSAVLELSSNEDEALLIVSDTGKGIPLEVQSKLMQRGYSYGKPSGNGLGLYHAATKVKEWGGSIAIDSKPGSGTNICIRLRKTSPPDWFTPVLSLQPHSIVAILDDDISIHQIWRERLSEIDPDGALSISHFFTANEFSAWSNLQLAAKSIVLLTDYELVKQGANGLEIIRNLPVGFKSYLVTSHHDESLVVSECKKAGIKIIPKSVAGLIPISVAKLPNKLDAILVNGDPVVRTMWWVSAKKEGKQIQVFQSMETLLAECDRIPRDTPVYIDPTSSDRHGLETELSALRAKGLENIFFGKGAPWR